MGVAMKIFFSPFLLFKLAHNLFYFLTVLAGSNQDRISSFNDDKILNANGAYQTACCMHKVIFTLGM